MVTVEGQQEGALGLDVLTSRLILNVQGGPFVEPTVDRAHNGG